jgi:hypothetical protein
MLLASAGSGFEERMMVTIDLEVLLESGLFSGG